MTFYKILNRYFKDWYFIMRENILDNAKKIHFIGIGGSGMCPMAEVLYNNGYEITGSDLSYSDTLDRLKSYGIKITIGQCEKNIENPDLVVYTAACKSDNPELSESRRRGIPTFERSVILGELTRKYQNTIGISGTHGKTSTTAMTTQILIEGKKDPSAIIGGKLPYIGGNSIVGKSDIMVCEACEYVDTFLQLTPAVSVILNIDADHLDYFKTLENIIVSFNKFSLQTTKAIVVNGDNENAMKAIEGLTHLKIITFGRNENCDYYVTDLNEADTVCEDFTIMHHGEAICRVSLKVPGEHNMMNALAAAATAHYMGTEGQYIKKALEEFGGVHRRFEILGKFDGITVADDFAHHPTELTAVLSSADKMGYDNVWAIFQPHTFSRTYLLLDDFAKALSIPEHLVMTEILAVREVNTYGIQTSDLEAKIPGSCHFGSFDEIANYVMSKAKKNDLILTLGGGDIYKCANLIAEKYGKLTK